MEFKNNKSNDDSETTRSSEKVVTEHEIQIRPPKIRVPEGVSGIHKCLQKSFITLVVGKPGSGKSHFIKEFITNPDLYYRKFDRIYFTTPSPLDGLNLEPDNWNKEFSPEWIYEKAVSNSDSFRDQKHPCNILFVLDDVISGIKKHEFDPLLTDLIFNRRKIVPNCTISYLIITQKYMLCPNRIRCNLTSIFFFRGNSDDINKILKENCDELNGYRKRIMMNHLRTNHHFVYIRSDSNQIYLNFKELL